MEDRKCQVIGRMPKTRLTERVKYTLERCKDIRDTEVFWIPQENEMVVVAECVNKRAAEYFEQRFRNLVSIFHLLPATAFPLNICSSDDIHETEGFRNSAAILNLPYDCLYLIFRQCTLKMQIALAKVCQRFFHVIRTLWRGQYRTFNYSLYNLEFTEHLTSNEINDFCFIVGPYVETLIFNTIFYFEIVQVHLAEMPGNTVSNARHFINSSLCKILKYFEHLRTFRVQGKFCVDFTINQLRIYSGSCLQNFELLDRDSRNIDGAYLPRFEKLEHICVRGCVNLSKHNFLKICTELTLLKSLDIVDCQYLEDPQFIEKCCKHLGERLETLKIHWPAVKSGETLLTMFSELRVLKHLELHWMTEAHSSTDIIGIFIQQLLKSKIKNVKILKFSIDRLPIENESFSYPNCDSRTFAKKREDSVARGREWILDDIQFDVFATAMQQMVRLEELHFEYCRIINNEKILKLPNLCKSLKLIKLIGHPMKDDNIMRRNWNEAAGCTLFLNSLTEYEYVEGVRSAMERNRLLRYPDIKYAATVRSIEIDFDNVF